MLEILWLVLGGALLFALGALSQRVTQKEQKLVTPPSVPMTAEAERLEQQWQALFCYDPQVMEEDDDD